MNNKRYLFFLLVILSIPGFSQHGDVFPELSGLYLGQKPPGMEPEIFAPGILNNDSFGAFCSVFSPNVDEFYFVRYKKDNNEAPGVLAYMNYKNNVWTVPDTLHFTSLTDYDNDMCISYDGGKIIFRSWRELPGGDKPDNHSSLWYSERKENIWSLAKPVYCGEKAVRTGYPSISRNNTLYFTYRGDSAVGIYRSYFKEGAYTKPEYVYTVIDTIVTEGDMFVSPDESYMIISCWNHPGNIGGSKGDLYITFKKEDGSWSEAINMGAKINTNCGENCPTVTPDGKYFFFNRYCEETNTGNIYWVDAKIIKEFRK